MHCSKFGDKQWQYSIQCWEYSLKTKHRQIDNFVVTGSTVSCHYDNLWCHQWRQSSQIYDLLFSVLNVENRFGLLKKAMDMCCRNKMWAVDLKCCEPVLVGAVNLMCHWPGIHRYDTDLDCGRDLSGMLRYMYDTDLGCWAWHWPGLLGMTLIWAAGLWHWPGLLGMTLIWAAGYDTDLGCWVWYWSGLLGMTLIWAAGLWHWFGLLGMTLI